MIHACPNRMWYVDGFLLPALRAQGIDSVTVWNDTQRGGNLKTCMAAFVSLSDTGDTWHLQDDVLPARDFGARVRALEGVRGVICGYVNEVAGPDGNLTGTQPTADMWYSFPCIRIPNRWAKDCAAWTVAGGDRSTVANSLIAKGCGDDWFFREWAARAHPDETVLNLTPCLVEHVDYLLGGSTVNPWRGHLSPAAYWDDAELVEELAQRIKAKRG